MAMPLSRLPCFTPRMLTVATVANVAMSRSARIVGCSNTGNNFAAFVAYTVLTAATAVVPSNQISTPVRKPTYGPNANST